MQKYKQNLKIEGNKVYSYGTHVATINGNRLQKVAGARASKTTSKHINYVGSEMGLIVEAANSESEADNPYRTVAVIASLGKLLGGAKDIKEENAWAKRMLKAGMGEGLSFPDDWESLSEEEKKRRLDGAIAIQLETPKRKGGKNE